MSINKKDYTLVARKLLKELLDDITGENESWLFGKKPSDCVMIGMIGADTTEASIIKGEDVDNQKFQAIPSIGLRFHVPSQTKKINIVLKGKLFYRSMPSFEDQCKFLVDKYSKANLDKNIDSVESLQNYVLEGAKSAGYIEPKEGLVLTYKSIALSEFEAFPFDLDNPEESGKLLNHKIQEILNQKVDSIADDSIIGKNVSRPITSFLSEPTFNKILDASVAKVLPRWNISLYTDVIDYDGYKEVVVQLVNDTEKNQLALSYETAIFNGGVQIHSDNGFVPISLSAVKHYYADNPEMPAIGSNCAVKQISGTCIETENIPMHEQKRVVTIDRYNQYVEFQKLIEEPILNLKMIWSEMSKKLLEYRNALKIAKREKSYAYCHAFSEEIDDFEREITRFLHGIQLIENRADVRKAFELMNRTFALNKKYKGWRLFQIVFIVSELMDMVNCEYENTPGFACNDIKNVDLIYFSTGGGKTETFLGCCVFAGFFDRIRGKENGVTAIIKYPLRLLAAQQLDRVLVLTINANKIKKQFSIAGDDFSVGFFTGSKNTPNKIEEKKRQDIDSMTQENRNAVYRQVDICPICKSEMNVFFDDDSWQLKHRCVNETCQYEPPIYIVDDEIYRYSPTFVISTIDKMANIGTSMGFKALFGQATNRCVKHGFISSGNRCKVPGCKCQIELDIDRKDPVPTLSIQDEMHLVNQSLGTFDSHYESLIQYYCSTLVPRAQRKTIKYIGATATISNFDEHIRNLYNKDAKKFPATVMRENFYSETDKTDICRIILGAALYGGSITDSFQKMITQMRIIVSQWMDSADSKLPILQAEGFEGDLLALKQVLQCYLIEIIYNNSKNDAGNIRAVLENQGNNALLAENLPVFNIAEISGDVEFKEIKNVMHDIEATDDKYQTSNVIVATSAISHGVDEDCFNQIFFFGMPNQTSEYIQAYSRVGRAYTGLVFDVFRIIRDRDKSFLKNFYNYHMYKELLIDPVPINRYAKNAIYCTLPGIVAALLYQHYVKKWYAMEVTKAIDNGLLTYDMLKNDVEAIYDCANQSSLMYKEIIEKEVRLIFNAFKNNTNMDVSISELIQKSTSHHKGPMTNLRDVDVPLEINLKEA